jgi:putative ABC transport system permease protein
MNQYNNLQPPAWPLKMLRFFLKAEYLEEIEGDMEELFLSHAEQTSVRKARFRYTVEINMLCSKTILKSPGETWLKRKPIRS